MGPTAYTVDVDENATRITKESLVKREMERESGVMNRSQKTCRKKLFQLLASLTVRMDRMEAPQERQPEKEKKGRGASVFGSIIGKGRARSREALDLTLPQEASSQVPPATYFGTRQRGYRQTAANVESAPFPHHELAQHYVQPPAYHPAPQRHHGPALCTQFARVSDARQRKLSIRPFDGEEVHQGLTTGFLSWGQRFVRQISFAKHASGFLWSEDVKVDVLGHHLAGLAERYYNRQFDGRWQEKPALKHKMQRLLHTFATNTTGRNSSSTW